MVGQRRGERLEGLRAAHRLGPCRRPTVLSASGVEGGGQPRRRMPRTAKGDGFVVVGGNR